jgi:hypothetical protein
MGARDRPTKEQAMNSVIEKLASSRVFKSAFDHGTLPALITSCFGAMISS